MFEAWNLGLFGTVLAGFFAIMNPVANTPIFLGLTDGMTERQRRSVAWRALLVAFFVVLTFASLGQVIFGVFGITAGGFRVAGGIIVFLIGYRMLQGEHSSLHQTKVAKRAGEEHNRKTLGPDAGITTADVTAAVAAAVAAREAQTHPHADGSHQKVLSVAVAPLGVPLLAGPGTIATTIGFSAGGWDRAVVTVLAFGTLCFCTWVAFMAGDRMTRMLGATVLTVITRLMGLVLAVIGVEMLLHGLREAGFG